MEDTKEAPDQLLLLPNELIGDVLSLLPFRSIVSFASVNKQHREHFSRQGGLWQQIVRKIFHWGTKDVDSIYGRIDWNKEFRVSSFFGEQIRNNKLKFDESNEAAVALTVEKDNKFAFSSPSADISKEELGPSLILQSATPLYPLPWGDFSVAYYEVQYDEDKGQIAIGLALDGYANELPGTGRNSFAILSGGQILLECIDNPHIISIKSGDTVGVGINFDAKSVFFTVNGHLVHEANKNEHDKTLINIKTLHATIFLIGERVTFEVNFSSKPFVFDVMDYQRKSKKRQNVTYSEKLAEHLTAFSDEETIDALIRSNFHGYVTDYNRPNFPLTQIHPLIYYLMYDTQPENAQQFESNPVVSFTRSMLDRIEILPKLRDSDMLLSNLKVVIERANENAEGLSLEEALSKVLNMSYTALYAWLERITASLLPSIVEDAFTNSSPWSVGLLAFKIITSIDHPTPANQYIIDLCCAAIVGAHQQQTGDQFDPRVQKTYSMDELAECVNLLVQIVFKSRLLALLDTIQGKLAREVPKKAIELDIYQRVYGNDKRLNDLMTRKMAAANQRLPLRLPTPQFIPIQILSHMNERVFVIPFLYGVFSLDIPFTAAKTKDEYFKLVRAKCEALVTPVLKKGFLQQMLDEMPKLKKELNATDLIRGFIIPALSSIEGLFGVKYDQNLASVTPQKFEKFLLEQIAELDKENKKETKKKRRAKKKRAAEVSSGMDVQTGLVIAAVTGVIAATVAVAVMFWKRKN